MASNNVRTQEITIKNGWFKYNYGTFGLAIYYQYFWSSLYGQGREIYLPINPEWSSECKFPKKRNLGWTELLWINWSKVQQTLKHNPL